MTIRDQAISADGIPIWYEVGGEGPTALVFVHGWSCDRTYWREQLPHFSKRFRVVAMDLAGHGESEGERAEWTMPAFGADVVAVVDRLGLDDVIFVGHSMGGDVIAEAARGLGDRVRALVAVDVYTSLDTPWNDAELLAFEAPIRRDFVPATRALVETMFLPEADPALVDWIAGDMAAAPPQIALDALAHAIRNAPAFSAGIRELRLPVIAINPGYRPTDVEDLRRHGLEVVLMPNVGHFLMLEDPAGFNAILEQVVEGLGNRR